MARRFVAAVVVGALALAPLTPALAAAGPGLEKRRIGSPKRAVWRGRSRVPATV